MATAADKAAEEARAVRDAAGDAAQAAKERAAAAAHSVQARQPLLQPAGQEIQGSGTGGYS